MTLDAGGTNFVFSALRGSEEVVKPFTRPAYPDDLGECTRSIIEGFGDVQRQLPGDPDAISFAFPGPADYERGIIGNLPNFKAFTGGVPLGALLEDHFHIPVFINNDGNLFALGEALAGLLPDVNRQLEMAGSTKRFHNLIGFTLGTGFGGGIVLDGRLITGDNSCGAEVHNSLNKFNPSWNAEESISTRAIRRVYAARAGIRMQDAPAPKDIAAIARGTLKGGIDAARSSFDEFGEALGSSIANALSFIDGIVVLGGGLTAAHDLFAPAMFREVNRNYQDYLGNFSGRLPVKVFDLDDEEAFPGFITGKTEEIRIPGSDRTVKYDSLPRTGIAVSRLGTSRAVGLGAYSFAMERL